MSLILSDPFQLRMVATGFGWAASDERLAPELDAYARRITAPDGGHSAVPETWQQ